MRRQRTQGWGACSDAAAATPGKLLPTWWLSYYVDGTEVRESANTVTRKVALDLLRERVKGLCDGTVVDPARERLTVGDLLDGLLAYYGRQEHRSLPSVRSQIKAWRTALGETRALAVTTKRLDRIISTWQEADVKSATINRRLSLLRRAYRLAKLRLDPVRLDFTDVFVAETSARGRYLTAEAFAAIYRNLPGHLKDLFEFSCLVGTRKGQLTRTTWAHWNQETREFTWTGAEVKAKTDFVLPLDGRPLELIVALHAQRRLHCRYVFHGPHCGPGRRPSKDFGCVGDFRKAWVTACRKAGFPVGRKKGGFVFHNTRHTAVTNLVNAGVPAHEAMAVSGHRTRSVFDRYSIPLKDQTRAAMRRTSAYVASLPDTPTVTPLTAKR